MEYREGVHGFSSILNYSVELCTVKVYMESRLFCTILLYCVTGMGDLDSLLFYTILLYCVTGMVYMESRLFCCISIIVYRDGVHGFSIIL